MKNIKLTDKQLKYVKEALKFYVHETTHDPELLNGQAGLPDGKEKTALIDFIKKLEGKK